MCSSAKKICLEDISESEEEVATMEKPWNELPDEALQNIFGYLRAKDLKSASLACKKYNKVIWSSPEIIKKMKLKIYGSQHFNRSFHSTRKYQNFEMVEEMTRTPDNSLGIWNSFNTSQATSFKFSGLSQGVAGLLLLLTRMPLLEDLSIKCDFSERTSHTKVDLPKLKKLRSNDDAIFEFITASNVVDINVNASRDDLTTNFLIRCPKVTTMETNSDVLTYLAKAINNHEVDLKLSSIILNLRSLHSIDNQSAFLMSQEQTLTTLELRVDWGIDLPTSFYENVLGRLANLTNLYLRCCGKFNENDFYYLPQLEKLADDFGTSINSIARYNRKLSYLCCESITTMLDDGLTFRNLTHLVVSFYWEEQDCGKLASVIKNCPSIETVELGNVKRFYCDETVRLQNIENRATFADAIDVMLQKPTLRFLKLRSAKCDNLEEIFDKICSNSGNLKILEHCGMFPDTTTSFTFPYDPVEQKKRFNEIFKPNQEVKNLEADSPPTLLSTSSPTSST